MTLDAVEAGRDPTAFADHRTSVQRAGDDAADSNALSPPADSWLMPEPDVTEPDAAGKSVSSALAATSAEPQPSAMPPWSNAPVPTGYQLDRTGVSQTGTGARIAGPVWIEATTYDKTTGDHGVVIAWIDVHGAHRELPVLRDELHNVGSHSPLIGRLARLGLRVVPGNERAVVKYLAEYDPSQLARVQAVSRTGWIDADDHELQYMLPAPTGLIAIGASTPAIFQPERHSPSSATMFPRSTLEAWNHHVLKRCAEHPLLLFPIAWALAGPLLRFAELESGGFHYYGQTSRGKTTAAQVAASVWGCGADPAESADRSYVQKWNSTANALEALLLAHNDALLVLDELHTCDAKDFGAVIYNMTGGKGRQALDRERSLRAPRQWRTPFFSTGEVSSLQRIEEGGNHAHAGQRVRLIDIPTGTAIIGTSANMEPGQYSELLKAACVRHFGTAGPAFVRALVAEYETVGQLVGTIKSMVADYGQRLTPASAAPEARRAIKRFALVAVAGVMAVRLGIISCSVAQVETAVRAALRAWITDDSNLPDRLRGVMRVIQFLERHASRFQDMDLHYLQPPRDRAGFVGYDGPSRGRAYFLFPEAFTEACGGFNPRDTAQALKEFGYLVHDAKRSDSKRDFGDGRRRVYVIPAAVRDFDPAPVAGEDD